MKILTRWIDESGTCLFYILIALLFALVSMFSPPVFAQGDVFSSRVVITGLNYPWQITWGPDDHLWVTERMGRHVSRVNPANGSRTVAITIDEVYARDDQMGLMGMALHPQLLRRTGEDYVYVAYTYREGAELTGRPRAKIRRYTYDPSTQTLGKPLDVISGLPASGDHNSGRLKIGPDGKLFYTIGDQGANHSSYKCNVNRALDLPSAAEVSARDWSTYQGKILRLNLDGSIPADNPAIGNVRSHVYSYGHRNAQGIVFGPGGKLYSSEHGPKTDDEVNLIQAGKNYGWPRVAGYIDDKAYTYDNWSASAPTPCKSLEYNAVRTPASVPRLKESSFVDSNFVPPIKTFGTVDNDFKFERPDCSGNACYPSIAPSSIEIYPSSSVAVAIPHWVTSLLIPSLKRGSVFRLTLSADGNSIIGDERELWRSKNRYRDVAINPDGRTFYVATDNDGENPGAILEFRYQGAKPAIPTK
jgi:PQQ-dependent dehydrogenase (s-GDH family)